MHRTVAVTAILVLLAGCGGDDDGSGGPPAADVDIEFAESFEVDNIVIERDARGRQ